MEKIAGKNEDKRKVISGTNLAANPNRTYKSLAFLKFLVEQREQKDPWAFTDKPKLEKLDTISLEMFKTFISSKEGPVVICLDEFGANLDVKKVQEIDLVLLFFFAEICSERVSVLLLLWALIIKLQIF